MVKLGRVRHGHVDRLSLDQNQQPERSFVSCCLLCHWARIPYKVRGQIHSNQKERFHKEVIVGRAVLIVHRFNSLQVFLSLLYFQIFSFLIIAL